jgi:hypothetical protein
MHEPEAFVREGAEHGDPEFIIAEWYGALRLVVYAPGVTHHATRRGTARRIVFRSRSDRRVYFGLVRDQGIRDSLIRPTVQVIDAKRVS